MSYFKKFPKMIFDMKNDGNYKLLPDILRRVKQRNAIKDGQFVFDNYDVKDGEKPEDIAYKWFGDAELHWVILMTNDITDRYYEWPMNTQTFNDYMVDKYQAQSGRIGEDVLDWTKDETIDENIIYYVKTV